MNLRERSNQPEWMDTIDLPEPVLAKTLDFLRITNQFFGGAGVVIKYLNRWSARWPINALIRVLDVGTGGGDIPIAIARWARRRGRRVKVTGLDLIPRVARIAERNSAGEPNVDIRQGDLFDLVQTGETFDYVTASLFLHHMAPARMLETLEAFNVLARRGMIVSDLHRSTAGYVAVSALARLVGNEVVQHDGPLSVRRGFRLPELHLMADSVGLDYLKPRAEPWFRVSLAGEKP